MKPERTLSGPSLSSRAPNFGLDALQTLATLGDDVHTLLEDVLRCRRGHGDGGEPAQVCRSPGGTTFVAHVVAQEEGLQAKARGVELVASGFPGAREVTVG